MTLFVTSLLTDAPWFWRMVAFGLMGVVVGNLLCRWMICLTVPASSSVAAVHVQHDKATRWHRVPLVGAFLARGRGRYCGQPTGYWWPAVEIGTAALFAAFAYLYLDLKCQQTPDVVPGEFWRLGRLFYHLILILLLITATGTDFRDYTIPDWITIPGIIIGVAGAAISGDLQMMHVWVDWHYEVPGYQGPFRPEWMAQHRHLHGLAWSLCGIAVGTASSGIVRAVSKLLLGQEAMGFGDITLMAMIGSFIGWQPVLFVLLIAPLCGVAMSVAVRLLTERTFIPYGPYLSAATVVVLFTWRWLWMLQFPISQDRTFSMRLLMGDWQTLLIVAGISLGAFVGLLGLLRAYRTIPVAAKTSRPSDDDATTRLHDDDTPHDARPAP